MQAGYLDLISWDKQQDMSELIMRRLVKEESVTKQTILSHLGRIYGILAYYRRLLWRDSRYTEKRVTRRKVGTRRLRIPKKRMNQVNNIVEACDHTQEHYNGHDKGRNSKPQRIRR